MTSARRCSCRPARRLRFVRSVKEEFLNRVVPLGERRLRATLDAFATHYHRERNHRGLANGLIDPPPAQPTTGAVRRCSRVGGFSATTTGQLRRRAASDRVLGHNGLFTLQGVRESHSSIRVVPQAPGHVVLFPREYSEAVTVQSRVSVVDFLRSPGTSKSRAGRAPATGCSGHLNGALRRKRRASGSRVRSTGA